MLVEASINYRELYEEFGGAAVDKNDDASVVRRYKLKSELTQDTIRQYISCFDITSCDLEK